MSSHDNLWMSKVQKNDEFYTLYGDIEKEISHYNGMFSGKTIYCPCDDFRNSNFVKFFKNNFNELGIRGLVATHIDFSNSKSDKYEYDGKKDTVSKLGGNGDFASDECCEIRDKCDVVVTNPPFSLFKKFFNWIGNKDFLIIGNFNAVAWKDVFPSIKSGRVHLGWSKRGMSFLLPNGEIGGTNSCWFTTLVHDKCNVILSLDKEYSSLEYPKYDNYDAIEVSKTKNIPKNYYGVMGVPITFLDKFNPSQFEIVTIAAGNSWKNFKDDLIALNFNPDIKYGGGLGACVLNGKGLFARLMIRNKM